MAEKPRRNFLGYAATAIVCGVVAGVGGVFAGQSMAPPTGATVTKTETKTVTEPGAPGATATVTQTQTQTQTKTVEAPGGTVTRTVTATPGEPPRIIKIGTTVPLTGAGAASAGWFKNLYEGWAEEVNAMGGIYVAEYGQRLPVQFTMYDDKNDPATAQKYFERLITEDNIDFLFGAWGDPCNVPCSVIAKKYKVPMLIGCGAAPVIYQAPNRYAFDTQEVLPKWMWDQTDMMKYEGITKTVGICRTDEPYAEPVRKGFVWYLDQVGGFEVTVDELAPPDVADWTAQIIKLKAADPDVTVCPIIVAPAHGTLWKQMKELAYTPKEYIPTPMEAACPNIDMVDGLVTNSFFVPDPPFSGVYGREFLDKLLAKCGIDPNLYLEAIASMYLAEEMIHLAIEYAGTLDREAVTDQLHKLYWMSGTSGPNRMQEYELMDYGLMQGVGSVLWHPIQYFGGKWYRIWPLNIKNHEHKYPNFT